MPQTAAMTAAEQAQQQAAADPEAVRKRFQRAEDDWAVETSKRRRVLYKDVEEMVNVGFLSHQLQVGNLFLSLRSLSPGDTFLLSHRVGVGGGDRLWKVWTVATSLMMINGVSLLEHPEATPRIYDMVRKLPPTVVDTLFTISLGLYNRTTMALLRTESYCYEHYSRMNWRMCGRKPPSLQGITGIPGVSRLGMNHVQRLWVAFNLTEDDRDRMLRDWAAAKLVASATAPKGIRKLNAADDRLRKAEETRRKDAIEKMVREVLFGAEAEVNTETWKVLVEGEVYEVPAVKTARTDAELTEDFRMWVAGEKDWHDIIVDTYKARLRAKFEGEKLAREEALTDSQRQPGVTGGTQMVGYTLEQIRDLRPELLEPQQQTKRVFDNSAPTAIFQKWVKPEVQSGRLQADEHGVYETPIQRPDPKSLQDQVATRRPSLSTEPIGTPPIEEGD